MSNPFFWLGISILLVAISLMALLTVAIFTLQELARAARSAEKLLDTLNQELPATLRDLRLTGQDLSGLTDEVSGGMQSARNVVEQVDKGLTEAKVQAQKAQITTRSLLAGATAAFQVLVGKPRRRRRPPTRRPSPVQSPATPPVAPPDARTPDTRAPNTRAPNTSKSTPATSDLAAEAAPENSQKPNRAPAAEEHSTAAAQTAVQTTETDVIPVTPDSKDAEITS